MTWRLGPKDLGAGGKGDGLRQRGRVRGSAKGAVKNREQRGDCLVGRRSVVLACKK